MSSLERRSALTESNTPIEVHQENTTTVYSTPANHKDAVANVASAEAVVTDSLWEAKYRNLIVKLSLAEEAQDRLLNDITARDKASEQLVAALEEENLTFRNKNADMMEELEKLRSYISMSEEAFSKLTEENKRLVELDDSKKKQEVYPTSSVSNINVSSMTPSTNSSNDRTFKALLDMYHMLTGVDVELLGDSVDRRNVPYHVHVLASDVRFSLIHDTSSKNISYTPIVTDENRNAMKDLPEYMHDDIAFAESDLRKFMRKIDY